MRQPFNRYSRNEGSRRGSWLLSMLGLIFWSAVVLVPLVFVAGFVVRART